VCGGGGILEDARTRGRKLEPRIAGQEGHVLKVGGEVVIVHDAAKLPTHRIAPAVERDMADTAAPVFGGRAKQRRIVVLLHVDRAPAHAQKALGVLVDRHAANTLLVMTAARHAGMDPGLRSRALVLTKALADPKRADLHSADLHSAGRAAATFKSLAQLKRAGGAEPVARLLLDALLAAAAEPRERVDMHELTSLAARVEHMCALASRGANSGPAKSVTDAGLALFVAARDRRVSGGPRTSVAR
jgi:hypothetical protein